MKTNEEIVEELEREFMLKMELGDVDENSGFQAIRWKNEEKSFDDLADFVLKALQAKDEQARQEKIALVESVPEYYEDSEGKGFPCPTIEKWKNEKLTQLKK